MGRVTDIGELASAYSKNHFLNGRSSIFKSLRTELESGTMYTMVQPLPGCAFVTPSYQGSSRVERAKILLPILESLSRLN